MFPIGDVNPFWRRPFVTWALLILNILMFILQWVLGIPFTLALSFVPAELTALLQGSGDFTVIRDLFTAMFLHGSLGHIFGNMLFLWIFGDNVEARLGKGWYLPFYLLCGIAASISQYAIDPLSEIPNLGASGAISGVLGAYLIFFPVARVNVFIWPFSLFLGTLGVPAFIWIGLWFVLQLFSGIQDMGRITQGGVAFWAHIGGFVAGLILLIFIPRRPPPPQARQPRP